MQKPGVREKECIEIKNARVHNLKNISLTIPRDKFIVVTGISGSGKSSLAFDTLYAEGQRRYVESLSSYARQFLGRIQKPEVDFIHGIPPAIAIEQKVNTRNPRSTVGTSTEIYDYLRLLFARIGKTYSPVSGKMVKKHSVTDVVDYILSFPEGTKCLILSPVVNHNKSLEERLQSFILQGFTRIENRGEIDKIENVLQQKTLDASEMYLLIDRTVSTPDDDTKARIADSVQTAFFEGHGECMIKVLNEKGEKHNFSNRFEADGITFEEPTEHLFSFNNPIGACPLCEGYGKIIGIDEDLVIPNKSLSVYEDAIVCWKGEKMKKWKERVMYHAEKSGFPIHKPYHALTKDQKYMLWHGSRYFKGIYSFFDYLEEKKYKIQYRVMLSRYRGKTTCTECNGTRLRKEASYIKMKEKTLPGLVDFSIREVYDFFHTLQLDKHDHQIAHRLLLEIQSRLQYLMDVGLHYLTLNRLSSTLSGGESQRINLATSLGSSLVGSLYILDEPSIGLHPRDTHRLISVLQKLNDIGNTVLVVEHDEDIIKAADQLIDIGPLAGRLGGEIIFQGNQQALKSSKKSLTGKYLYEKGLIPVPISRRHWNNYIRITGARENNLKNITTKIPLNTLTAITGVSGSGKSTLVKNTLFPALNKIYNGFGEKTGEHDLVDGNIDAITQVEFVDQNPIGKSSRSNPVTYLKAYDEIRKLMSDQPAGKQSGLKPSHFSFNVDGGRCEECQGEGIIRVEMQFMADVELICESCQGKRFKEDILEITYQQKNIYDILEMTVDEAIEFFSSKKSGTEKRIVQKLSPLANVGLGYIKLGQSSSTLSGGESQRVKLASFLSKENSTERILFMFDEPTTGLHFHDIKKLLDAFHALIENGHSILVIEHNLEIIKSADWIIDLGPEGGEHGGYIIFEGPPEELVKNPSSYTAKYLKEKLA